MANDRGSLKAIARRAMIERGFEPDYSPAADTFGNGNSYINTA